MGNSQELWSANQLRAAEVECILECEEIVGVTNEDANQFVDSATPQNHVECHQNPGKIDGL